MIQQTMAKVSALYLLPLMTPEDELIYYYLYYCLFPPLLNFPLSLFPFFFLSVYPCLTNTAVRAHFVESSTRSFTATYQQHHTDRKDQVVTLEAGIKQAPRETKHVQLTSPARLTLTQPMRQK